MLEPLADAPLAVQIHVAAACAAIVSTPAQVLRRPGDGLHRAFGYVWVCAMALTSASSFLIHDIRLFGPFSPIHALSAFVLFSLAMGVRAARRGQIDRHRAHLAGCAFWGLGVAGLFTLLPGRRMSAVLFPGVEVAGFLAMAALLVAVTLALRWPAVSRAAASRRSFAGLGRRSSGRSR